MEKDYGYLNAVTLSGDGGSAIVSDKPIFLDKDL